MDASKTRLVVESTPEVEATPYERTLSRLVVAQTNGPTKVSLLPDNALLVAGAGENLTCFASFLEFSPHSTPGDHHHYEYFDGNTSISPDSLPLIISRA